MIANVNVSSINIISTRIEDNICCLWFLTSAAHAVDLSFHSLVIKLPSYESGLQGLLRIALLLQKHL